MKNKNRQLTFSILVALLSLTLSVIASLQANAQETSATEVNTSSVNKDVIEAAALPKKWKAEISSYYYDFEGTRSANGDLYTFGNSTLALQLMSLQYQVSPKWTLLVMGQYLDNFVETKMFGNIYYDRVKGMGDTFVSGITPLVLSSNFLLFADAGVSLPTGSINNKNAYNPKSNYAYNMQLGSGTTDAVLGLTPMYIQGPMQLGSHVTAILRNGKNANGYRLGNLYKLDAWADYNTASGLTPRLVGYYKYKDAIDGEDETLVRQPLTEFYYHPQINWDLSVAVKYEKTLGPVALGAELGRPVAQDSQNFDAAVVSTEYYGNLKVSGSF